MRAAGGVGIRSFSCTSMFDGTVFAWRVTRPAPRKAEQMLAEVNDGLKTTLHVSRNSSLVIQEYGCKPGSHLLAIGAL